MSILTYNRVFQRAAYTVVTVSSILLTSCGSESDKSAPQESVHVDVPETRISLLTSMSESPEKQIEGNIRFCAVAYLVGDYNAVLQRGCAGLRYGRAHNVEKSQDIAPYVLAALELRVEQLEGHDDVYGVSDFIVDYALVRPFILARAVETELNDLEALKSRYDVLHAPADLDAQIRASLGNESEQAIVFSSTPQTNPPADQPAP